MKKRRVKSQFSQTSATVFRTLIVSLQKISTDMSHNKEERGPNLMRKYVWVIDTILRYHRISFKELNKKWMDCELSRGEELAKRTFDNWREVISDIFQIDIENENCGEYRYYILNEREFRKDERRFWLYSTFSVNNALENSQRIRERILLEDVPSGQEYLQPIIETMRENRVLHITYYFYNTGEDMSFTVCPYCVKLFRQRWYMVAKPDYDEKKLRIYSLDRIRSLQTTDKTFAMPAGWSAKDYFKDSYGIFAGTDVAPQRILLKVSAGQANYIRDLKLHKSQVEIERNDEYSIFKYFLRPYYDFIQEVLWNGGDVEVLEPEWLRKEIAGMIHRMWNKYKNDQK